MTPSPAAKADIASLMTWTAQESPTRYVPGVNAMMDLVAKDVAGLPIAVERIAGREGLGDALLLAAGPANGQKPILVMSHLDTVHPVGTAAKDLPVRVEGDRLYGPGVYDMKGGRGSPCRPSRTPPPRRAEAPGALPVHARRGDRQPDHARRHRGRGPQGLACAGHGAGARRRADRHRAQGRRPLRGDHRGASAHSGSRHQDGRSAIREAARQILAIEGMTDYARGVTTTVALMSGGTAPNVIPQHAWFTVDLRVRTAADGAEMEAALLGLKSHDPDVKVKAFGAMNRPPYEKDAAVAALYETARQLAAGFGLDLQDCPMTGGGSDGNFTAALGVPTLDGLGIDGDGAHTLHEYGLISSIAPRRELMRRLLLAL